MLFTVIQSHKYVLTAAALVHHTQVSWVSSLRLVPAGGSFCLDQRKHLPDNAGVSRSIYGLCLYGLCGSVISR